MQNLSLPSQESPPVVGRDVAQLLIIDDDLVQRKFIAAIARQAGYHPVEANSFIQATQFLHQTAFDCITLDLSLGENDGVEVIRVLAELCDSVPIIVISGCEQRILNSTVRIAESLGLTILKPLSKPVDLTELRTSLMRESHDIPLKNRPFRHQHEISRDQLIAALQADELFTVFQPKIDLMTQRVLGCEALARWKSSNFGVIPPSVFVPLAERWDLMEQLTDQMLRNAVSAFADLAAQDPSFSVAVNISASSLTDISFPEKIERTLAEVGFPPKALILEVTESAVMTDVAKATDILVRLRIKGMGLAIDDFGTGYSSLTALVRMPFSEMKIDGSFVKDCNTDPDMAKIVQASMRLAHEFEMKTVAEGIEDSQVNAILRDSGCHAGQGYFFARPLEISRFKSWSANWSRGIKAAHPDLQLRAG